MSLTIEVDKNNHSLLEVIFIISTSAVNYFNIYKAYTIMKTKLFTLFLALVASVGIIFAAEKVQIGDLYYNLDVENKKAEVTYEYQLLQENYSGLIIANIPASINYNGTNYSVTGIGARAFEDCRSLTSLTIPNSVTSIGDDAFYGCTSLASVTIPNSVTSIGGSAFHGCTSLASVTIPNSVTSIGIGAFSGCTNLPVIDNIRYADTYLVEAIDKSLSTYTIKEGTKWIGYNAFYNCTSLTSITIPNSVTSIERDAFYGCSGLPVFDNIRYADTYLIGAVDKSLSTYAIKEGTKWIGSQAFKNCTRLTSVTIPNSVISIGENAFSSCSSLTSVTIPNSIISIGEYAFMNCKKMLALTIPNSVTSIGAETFSGCTSLSSITIPNSVTSIGKYAFYSCTNLTSVTIPNSVTSIGGSAFYGCTSLASVTIPNSVTSIGGSAFYGCTSLASVTIPNSVTSIGKYAFYSCTNLTSVTIPNSVTSIGDRAFYGCTGLESVTIGNSVTSIGGSAFYGCTSLASVTIPNSVTSIGSSAFYGCTSLPVVDNIRYADTYLIGAVDTSLSTCHIKESTKWIGPRAFMNCTRLTSVIIPNSVTSIGIGAFSGCTNLPIIDNIRYADTYLVEAIDKSLSTYAIKEGTKWIGYNAFYGCTSLASITIPNSVTSIGDRAFYGCTSLTSVTIPNGVTSIGEYAFMNCTSLASVTIPNSVTSIGSSAFYDCTSLASVTIPNSVTSIGGSAFYGCTSLASIYVPCGEIGRFKQMLNDDRVQYAPRPYKISMLAQNGYVSNNISELLICESLVTFTAMPNRGYRFMQWADGSTNNPRTVELTQDTTMEAIFDYLLSNFCGQNNALRWILDTTLMSLDITGSGTLSENYTYGTYVKSLTIGNEITVIGKSAFAEFTDLRTVIFGSSVKVLEAKAFSGCTSIEMITCYSQRPPTVNNNALEGLPYSTIVYVPADYLNNYVMHDSWGLYDVRPLGAKPTTTEEVQLEPTETAVTIVWPSISGAASYELVIRDKSGNVICTLLFNEQGQLTSIAFNAPGRRSPNQTQADGFSFTVTGLDSGTGYDLTITAKNSSGTTLDQKVMSFTTDEVTTPTSQTTINQVPTTTKFIHNGQLYILRDGKTYSVQGQEVK